MAKATKKQISKLRLNVGVKFNGNFYATNIPATSNITFLDWDEESIQGRCGYLLNALCLEYPELNPRLADLPDDWAEKAIMYGYGITAPLMQCITAKLITLEDAGFAKEWTDEEMKLSYGFVSEHIDETLEYLFSTTKQKVVSNAPVVNSKTGLPVAGTRVVN
ncbi:hypothetical protein [Sapientia aquatica]|uniref:Uncharacterized protein n=1 Tax=Sapientia aquatica TaxID=1549640 RepID=A0A4R5VYP4_9BURK|nr:hypothetical protein [Sapientia aquatica]TDK63581.1 hypothetical protein E2I14_15380 [Sapientia aquatica]